jgi:hypothetical protein
MVNFISSMNIIEKFYEDGNAVLIILKFVKSLCMTVKFCFVLEW